MELRYDDVEGRVDLGVLLDDGKKIVFKSFLGLICPFEWITEEEAEELEKEGDPIEAPPSSYKVQPELQGRLICITGPPGGFSSYQHQHPPSVNLYQTSFIVFVCTTRPRQVNIGAAAQQGTRLCLL